MPSLKRAKIVSKHKYASRDSEQRIGGRRRYSDSESVKSIDFAFAALMSHPGVETLRAYVELESEMQP